MASRRSERTPSGAEDWQAWRVADGRFDAFSPVGASLAGGRWNPDFAHIVASRPEPVVWDARLFSRH